MASSRKAKTSASQVLTELCMKPTVFGRAANGRVDFQAVRLAELLQAGVERLAGRDR